MEIGTAGIEYSTFNYVNWQNRTITSCSGSSSSVVACGQFIVRTCRSVPSFYDWDWVNGFHLSGLLHVTGTFLVPPSFAASPILLWSRRRFDPTLNERNEDFSRRCTHARSVHKKKAINSGQLDTDNFAINISPNHRGLCFHPTNLHPNIQLHFLPLREEELTRQLLDV